MRRAKMYVLPLLLSVAACTSSQSQSASPAPTQTPAPTSTPSAASKEQDAMSSTDSLPPHVLSIAAKRGAPTTLVVLLHGFGADATSFHDIARALSPSFPDADFLTPDGFQASPGLGRQWFSIDGVTEANRGERMRAAGSAVSAWIDHQMDKRSLTHDKLVVIGFSQGAMVAGWLAVHRSPAPAAAVMFSGRFTDDRTPVANAVATPILMAHGEDDPRIPLSTQIPSAKLLEAWGAQVTRRVYPRLGHSIDARELKDATEFLQTALSTSPVQAQTPAAK